MKIAVSTATVGMDSIKMVPLHFSYTVHAASWELEYIHQEGMPFMHSNLIAKHPLPRQKINCLAGQCLP